MGENAVPKLPMHKRLPPFVPSSLRVVAVTFKPKRETVLAVPRSATA